MNSIILIGMPGSGKTTIGKLISSKLGMQFIDLDKLIEKTAGKTIPEIFSESGEEGFRSFETEAARTVCAYSGCVISCGGGIVTRSVNKSLIKDCNTVICIKRDVHKLSMEGRPLSRSLDDLLRMEAERAPLYDDFADYTVSNDGTLYEAADRLLEIINKVHTVQKNNIKENTMKNLPDVKLGIIAVSRDCFPITLSTSRRESLVNAYTGKYGYIYNCKTTVENERQMLEAVNDVKKNGVNALVVLLGNFGPETPETQIAQYFDGPVMYVASAEENIAVLSSDRGDALCGMLNCSYNLGLRKIKAFIPAYPVGTSEELADLINEFIPVSRALIGVSNLKIISFGPRPQDFFACNAPIKQLYDLGVEVEENSELDLFEAFEAHENDPRIPGIVNEMKEELGTETSIMPRLAQLELSLIDWAEEHKGSRKYVAFANKCWPAFEKYFRCVPCYVNSRLTAKGIPVSCEVDIYGALSEYIGLCVSNEPVTLLDINNSVPKDLYDHDIKGRFPYRLTELFMGFHCGNTPVCRLVKGELKYQVIMKRSLEPDTEPDITRGTLEGDIAASDVTLYRLQGAADGSLRSYIAQGEFLPVQTHSFGGIGIVAIKEMERFYRYVLIEKQFPHHGAFVFGKYGKALFDIFRFLGVEDISYNQPSGILYKAENPFN